MDLNNPAQADLYHKQVKQLKEASPTHLPLLIEHVRKLDAQAPKPGESKSSSQKVAAAKAVVAAAEEAIAAVDAREIAVATAVKNAEDTPELKAAKKEAEGKRDVLCEALHRKATALLQIEEELDYPGAAAPWNPCAAAGSTGTTSATGSAVASEGVSMEATSGAEGTEEREGTGSSQAAAVPQMPAAGAGVADKSAFDTALFELRKLVDTSEGAYLPLHAKAEARASRPGNALRSVERAIDLIKDGKKPSGPSSSGSVSFPSLRALYDWRHAILRAPSPHGVGNLTLHLADLDSQMMAKRFPITQSMF
ncbi:hypothetical protein DUNSADRAFT_13193 [Dunaliella salina]|uniref:Uncharacterized protein n=1 Tax=Dunaliella salina TaxID=3046 RepID=A0ABQ7G9U1_DUNSA|nr:hypothetical protein DUNSADRAFT_13193 [Dunaliella salina]|eukprot:KAF5831377.1 hypothetical protein DUNSADRAFT_13193 [Dunaliella salina]